MESDDEDFGAMTAELAADQHVISTEDSNSYTGSVESDGDQAAKQMYLENINQDASQTFVLTVHDETGEIHATNLSLDDQNACPADSPPPENVNDVSQAWFTSREDKSNLHNKGHNWKQGMWSKEEIDLLDANIRNYCIEHSILDPIEVIFEMTKDERKDFYRTVAKGLNRPLFSVYRRVIRMYDNKNHIGKYTVEEIDKLKKLRTKHGNNWQAIGVEMGRSASSIKDKCRLMKTNCNTGKWFPYEENRLAEAVYDLSNTVPGEIIVSGISWANVAERVVTRSEKQCRTKWLNYLNWKQVGGSEWTREDDINLVTKVCSVDVEDENDIDWGEMGIGWNSVRSPQWLRGKWWNLKRHVPRDQHSSFKDICQYLFTNHVANVHTNCDRRISEIRQLSSTPPPDVRLITTGTPTITLPQVSVVQAPSVVQFPIQFKANANYCQPGLDPALKVSQAFELPTGLTFASAGHPGTFFITTTGGATSLPYTTCTQTASGQFIFHTVSAGVLPTTDNVSVHMNLPPQLLISTQPDGSNVATLTTPSLNVSAIPNSFQLVKDELTQFEADNVILPETQLQSQSEMLQTISLARQEVLLHLREVNPFSLQELMDDKVLGQTNSHVPTDFIFSADSQLPGSNGSSSPVSSSTSDIQNNEQVAENIPPEEDS